MSEKKINDTKPKGLLSVEMAKSLKCPCGNLLIGEGIEGSTQPRKVNAPLLLRCGHSVCGSCIGKNGERTAVCKICGAPSELDRRRKKTWGLPKNAYLVGQFMMLALTMNLGGLSLSSESINSDPSEDATTSETTLSKASPSKASLSKGSPSKADTSKASPSKADISKADTSKADTSKADTSKADSSEADSFEADISEADISEADLFEDDLPSKEAEKESLVEAHISNDGTFIRCNCEKCEIKFGELFHNRMNCPLHEHGIMDLYCNDCDQVVCAYCVLYIHRGGKHNIMTLEDKDSPFWCKCINIIRDVKKRNKLIEITLKTVEDAASEGEVYEKAQRRVAEKFQHLHGIIQLLEEALLQQLEDAKQDRENSLQAVAEDLKEQIKAGETFCKELSVFKYGRKLAEALNVDHNVDEKWNAMRFLPAYIEPSDVTPEMNLKMFEFNEGIIDSVKKYCTLVTEEINIHDLYSEGPDDITAFLAQKKRLQEGKPALPPVTLPVVEPQRSPRPAVTQQSRGSRYQSHVSYKDRTLVQEPGRALKSQPQMAVAKTEGAQSQQPEESAKAELQLREEPVKENLKEPEERPQEEPSKTHTQQQERSAEKEAQEPQQPTQPEPQHPTKSEPQQPTIAEPQKPEESVKTPEKEQERPMHPKPQAPASPKGETKQQEDSVDKQVQLALQPIEAQFQESGHILKLKLQLPEQAPQTILQPQRLSPEYEVQPRLLQTKAELPPPMEPVKTQFRQRVQSSQTKPGQSSKPGQSAQKEMQQPQQQPKAQLQQPQHPTEKQLQPKYQATKEQPEQPQQPMQRLVQEPQQPMSSGGQESGQPMRRPKRSKKTAEQHPQQQIWTGVEEEQQRMQNGVEQPQQPMENSTPQPQQQMQSVAQQPQERTQNQQQQQQQPKENKVEEQSEQPMNRQVQQPQPPTRTQKPPQPTKKQMETQQPNKSQAQQPQQPTKNHGKQSQEPKKTQGQQPQQPTTPKLQQGAVGREKRNIRVVLDNNGRKVVVSETFEPLSQPSAPLLTCEEVEILNCQLEISQGAYHLDTVFVKNPGDFYVTLQYTENIKLAIKMEALRFGSSNESVPIKLYQGGVYLLCDEEDGEWHRVKILREPAATSKAVVKKVVAVKFIDHGKTKEVPASKLRSSPPTLLKLRPLAFKCKIYSVLPVGGEWCSEASKYLISVTQQPRCTLRVIVKACHHLEVDLHEARTSPKGAPEVTLRDHLLFMGYAAYTTAESWKAASLAKFDYPLQKRINPGYVFQARIKHVQSPSHFYVEKIGPDNSILAGMLEQLNAAYDIDKEDALISYPVLGIPCAAFSPSDKKWFRGTITSLPEIGMVGVEDIDTGDDVVLSWKYIRKIPPYCLNLAPQALRCSMVKGLPKNRYKWASGSTTKLQNERRIVKISVLGLIHKGLKVFVHYPANKEDVLLNSELIETCELTSKESPRRSHPTTPEVLESFDLWDSDYSVGMERFRLKEDLQTIKQGDLIDEADIKTVPPLNLEKYRLKNILIAAESPSSLILVRHRFKDVSQALDNEIHLHYSSLTDKDQTQWAPNMYCVAHHRKRKKWYRGLVVSIENDEEAKVLFIDLNEPQVLSFENIRQIKEEHLEWPGGSIKAHLDRVYPPEENWSMETCEYFLELIKEHSSKMHVAKLKRFEGQSLAIEIWVDPETGLCEDWTTLNVMMLEMKYAISEKEKFKPGPPPEEGEESTRDWIERDLPPDRLTFEGVTTAIDSRGTLTIQNFRKDWPALTMIHNLLSKTPPGDKNKKWDTGQTCFAYSAEDRLWYRGRIIRYNGHRQYIVYLVDYGRHITCKAEELQPSTRFHDVPILCHQFQLDNIIPVSGKGGWTREDIRRMKELILNKSCSVTIMTKGPGKPMLPVPFISMTINKDSVDVSHNLVSKGVARLKKAPTAPPKKAPTVPVPRVKVEKKFDGKTKGECIAAAAAMPVVKDRDSCKSADNERDPSNAPIYPPLTIPSVVRFPVQATEVKDERFSATIMEHESLPEKLKPILTTFKKMEEEIQKRAKEQETLKEIKRGSPCLCLYRSTGTWARARIVRPKKKKSVVVRYVDYGRTETVPFDRLRALHPDWLSHPAMSLSFSLSNVKRGSNTKEAAYDESIRESLTRTFLTVRIIKEHKDHYEAEVFSEDTNTLAYEDLLNLGVMTLQNCPLPKVV